MKIRFDTIPARYGHLRAHIERKQRREAILRVIGLIGLAAALVTTAALMIGLGNMAALVARVGGGA